MGVSPGWRVASSRRSAATLPDPYAIFYIPVICNPSVCVRKRGESCECRRPAKQDRRLLMTRFSRGWVCYFDGEREAPAARRSESATARRRLGAARVSEL